MPRRMRRWPMRKPIAVPLVVWGVVAPLLLAANALRAQRNLAALPSAPRAQELQMQVAAAQAPMQSPAQTIQPPSSPSSQPVVSSPAPAGEMLTRQQAEQIALKD